MLNGQVLSILCKATEYSKFVVFGNSLFFNGHLKINSFVFNNVKMQVNRGQSFLRSAVKIENVEGNYNNFLPHSLNNFSKKFIKSIKKN